MPQQSRFFSNELWWLRRKVRSGLRCAAYCLHGLLSVIICDWRWRRRVLRSPLPGQPSSIAVPPAATNQQPRLCARWTCCLRIEWMLVCSAFH